MSDNLKDADVVHDNVKVDHVARETIFFQELAKRGGQNVGKYMLLVAEQIQSGNTSMTLDQLTQALADAQK
jgi:hypothetical protein